MDNIVSNIFYGLNRHEVDINCLRRRLNKYDRNLTSVKFVLVAILLLEFKRNLQADKLEKTVSEEINKMKEELEQMKGE